MLVYLCPHLILLHMCPHTAMFLHNTGVHLRVALQQQLIYCICVLIQLYICVLMLVATCPNAGVQLAARTPLLQQLVLEDEGSRAANNTSTSTSTSSASSVKRAAASDTHTTHAAPAAAAAAAAATDTHSHSDAHSHSKLPDAAFGSALALGGGGGECHALGGTLGFRNASELRDDMKLGGAPGSALTLGTQFTGFTGIKVQTLTRKAVVGFRNPSELKDDLKLGTVPLSACAALSLNTHI
jgi:hypothetical protein